MCMTERQEPFCLCDDGYAASGLSCVAAERPRAARNRGADAIRARIVSLALAEGGRGPREVGSGMEDAPYELRRYIVPGELWCTDFVSWVYRSAGYPLTGGYDGGWLIKNNRAMRTWFDRRGRYVENGSIAWMDFEPRPGDYIRLHTPSGHGHSGIVRYVAGETLYTIEGNVGNHVRPRRHARFRESVRIDGIGALPIPDRQRIRLAHADDRAHSG
jgi:hypothetical protein